MKQAKDIEGLKLEIDESIFVSQLKEIYLQKANLFGMKVRMFSMGKELIDNKPLYFYKIENDQIIQIQLQK